MSDPKGVSPLQINEPAVRYNFELLKNADNSIDLKYDNYLGGKWVNPTINAAHNTYVELIASASFPTGMTAYLKSLLFTNMEAYALSIEIYDGTTLIYKLNMAAQSSFGLSENDLIGLKCTTSIRFKTQVFAAEAWSAGTYVGVGYFLKTT